MKIKYRNLYSLALLIIAIVIMQCKMPSKNSTVEVPVNSDLDTINFRIINNVKNFDEEVNSIYNRGRIISQINHEVLLLFNTNKKVPDDIYKYPKKMKEYNFIGGYGTGKFSGYYNFKDGKLQKIKDILICLFDKNDTIRIDTIKYYNIFDPVNNNINSNTYISKPDYIIIKNSIQK
jgi:hypothetical protein